MLRISDSPLSIEVVRVVPNGIVQNQIGVIQYLQSGFVGAEWLPQSGYFAKCLAVVLPVGRTEQNELAAIGFNCLAR